MMIDAHLQANKEEPSEFLQIWAINPLASYLAYYKRKARPFP